MVAEALRPLECVVCGRVAPVLSASGLCPRCFHAFEELATRIEGEAWRIRELEHAYAPSATDGSWATASVH
jgi:hypothetical protein